jgi:AraC family ethanolamine operon transcriptional activator
MQNSQVALIPHNRHLLAAGAEELEEAQPEKRRRYVQLGVGPLCGELHELQATSFQVFRERLDVGMRVEAAPPRHLVPFSVILATRGAARFCGVEMGPSNVVQAGGGEWDFVGTQGIDYVCCVFDRARFEQAAFDLTGRPAKAAWFRNQVRTRSGAAGDDLGRRLARLLSDLEVLSPQISDEASRQLEADLAQRTIAALCCGDEDPGVQPAWRRRRALRLALDLLDAASDPMPTIPELCRVAGVSQRTLEYAFREQLAMTPIRYLKLVRLNRVRRALRAASHEDATVTRIALACGFIELGRFASEYRNHFGELPSETLRSDARGSEAR